MQVLPAPAAGGAADGSFIVAMAGSMLWSDGGT